METIDRIKRVRRQTPNQPRDPKNPRPFPRIEGESDDSDPAASDSVLDGR